MVGTNQPFDLPFGPVANPRAAMATNIVQRVHLTVLIPRNKDRISIDLESEIVAGVWNLARVPGKKPTRSPHALAIQLVQLLIGIKLPQQASPGRLARDQITQAL